MCERQATVAVAVAEMAAGGAQGALPAPAAGRPALRGSRRRRMWELEPHAYCPVVGVCLPLAVLRRVVEKVLGGPAPQDDYELHCCTINECKQRTPVAERLQRELDERYALALRRAAACKCEHALAQWWAAEREAAQVPGALWAVLTHPRCDRALAERVLAEVHMLQHQVGAAQRVDLARHAELQQEHAALLRELAAAQERTTRALAERTALIERQGAELVRLRAALIQRDTLTASLRAQLSELEQAIPGLRTRQEQAAQIRAQQSRLHELERRLLQARQQAAEWRGQLEEARRAADEAAQEAAARALPQAGGDDGHDAAAAPPPDALRDKAVLCVGGRAGSVPVYRRLVEDTGGRFLHHDGGQEHHPQQLDASLAAADLVICQTGCISHDAYWRVKDHCKRHGTPCLFVDQPSAASLARGLRAIRIVPQG